MAKIEDGGPAFPTEEVEEMGVTLQYRSSGMSLRDWFAGQAMQARLTGSNVPRLDIRHAIASDAYAIADAMLEARAALRAQEGAK